MNTSCAPGSSLSLNYSQLFLLDFFRVLRMPDWTPPLSYVSVSLQSLQLWPDVTQKTEVLLLNFW